MKYLKYFVDFVELKTKVASLFPFLIALFYYLNNYQIINGFKPLNIFLFFTSMLCFDMATTAINHYMAFHHESAASIYDNNLVVAMKKLDISMKTNKLIIIILVITASLLGIILVLLSNIGVLLLGMLCFLIGFLYSTGPKPIAYTPFGEIFAGGAMGLILPVILIFTQYNHIPWELNPLLIVVFMPLAFLIGSILFGNNVCDHEMDVKNNRYTLAHYLSIDQSIIALYLSNLGAITFIIISVILNYLPVIYLILTMMIIPLSLNVKKFSIKVSKQESFPYIVKNFILFSFAYTIISIIEYLFM